MVLYKYIFTAIRKKNHFNKSLVNVQILEQDRIEFSEGIDFNKTNVSKEFDTCHYWSFLEKGFKYESYLCNGCHNLLRKAINFKDVVVVSVEWNDYRIHIWYMSKDNAINMVI